MVVSYITLLNSLICWGTTKIFMRSTQAVQEAREGKRKEFLQGLLKSCTTIHTLSSNRFLDRCGLFGTQDLLFLKHQGQTMIPDLWVQSSLYVRQNGHLKSRRLLYIFLWWILAGHSWENKEMWSSVRRGWSQLGSRQRSHKELNNSQKLFGNKRTTH